MPPRICVVLPTGGGKTRIAVELIWRVGAGASQWGVARETLDATSGPLRDYQRSTVEQVLTLAGSENTHPTGGALFLVHRRELLQQAADRLRDALGYLNVGVIAPGFDASPHSAVQVATVQTLLAREQRPPAGLIVLDEAHHYVPDVSWTAVLDAYPDTLIVGLTATPQRQDGAALGDLFTHLVTAASYSDLITAGHLVGCRVFQPPAELGSAELALDPLTAYQRYGEDGQAFGFAPTVKAAHEFAERFTDAGIASAAVDGKQAKRDRDAALQSFRARQCKVLWNYNVLTEGVDIPEASVVLIGRPFHHVGSFLQACGRVLRAAESKGDAIIIDLTGATHKHGFPTQDRTYSLRGSGITLSDAPPPLRNCLQCGATLHAHIMRCPHCGWAFPRPDPRLPKIFSLELREVYNAAGTPQDAKLREYQRLRALARDKGWSASWVVREYNKLFKEAITVTDATTEEKQSELAKLRAVAQQKGYKDGWAAYRYKATFGSWPRRA